MKSTVTAFVKLSCAFVGLASLAHAGLAQAEPVKVSLASASMNYAPYLVAIDKGYFREEGLEVEIVKAPGASATAALLSGDIPFSTSGATAMSAAMKGAAVKLVFFPWDRPAFQVWATQPDLKTLDDLKGKTVGIKSRGDAFEIALRMVLMNHKIDPASIGYTALGQGNGRFATIMSGSLPAAVISSLDVEKLREMGILDKAHLVYDMYDDVRMPLTSLAVSDAVIQRDRGLVKRFVRASLKGFRYAAAFKEQTIDIVAKYGDGGRSRDVVASDYDDVLASKSEDGTVPLSAMRTEIAVRGQIMQLAPDKLPKVEKIFDLGMAEEANKELASGGWKPTP
ncbi:MAG TPA: ABC transporter substrate-binding protein [Alphaproteobacteria bacterium]|jgi:NitT/TauT family transport system substrate-binding protein